VTQCAVVYMIKCVCVCVQLYKIIIYQTVKATGATVRVRV